MNRCECGHTDIYHEDMTGPCEFCSCYGFELDLDGDGHREPDGFEGYDER